MRVVTRIVMLVLLWLLAWGRFSRANLLSGLVVAVMLLLVFPPESRQRNTSVRVDPIGMARLIGYVLVQLVASNAVMVGDVLRARLRVRPGVLRHQLASPSEEVITMMTGIIALSPGTMTVDVDRASTSIYVHFFRLADIEAARADLRKLERLVLGAVSPRERP